MYTVPGVNCTAGTTATVPAGAIPNVTPDSIWLAGLSTCHFTLDVASSLTMMAATPQSGLHEKTGLVPPEAETDNPVPQASVSSLQLEAAAQRTSTSR